MPSKETSTANETLDKWFGRSDFTPPATWYVGLLDASDTELSGGGYARVAVANNTTNFPAASAKQKSIAAAVTFPTAAGDWDEAAKVGFWTASTGGTLKFKTLLDAPVTVLDGIEFSFLAGDLVFIEG
ncbi:MAG: hypothetical protein JSS81_26815 [Acidobacteria bacterium]|nr:hypothetical protein [Acidobacteriota bacterium]